MKAFTRIQIIFFFLPLIFFDLMIFFTIIGSVDGVGISFIFMVGFSIYDIYLVVRPTLEINEKFVRIGKNRIMIEDIKEVKIVGKGKYYTVIVVSKNDDVITLKNVYKGDKILTFLENSHKE